MMTSISNSSSLQVVSHPFQYNYYRIMTLVMSYMIEINKVMVFRECRFINKTI